MTKLWTAAALLGLALSACGGSDPVDLASAVTPSTRSTSSTEETSPSDPSDSTEGETSTSTIEDAVGSDAEGDSTDTEDSSGEGASGENKAGSEATGKAGGSQTKPKTKTQTKAPKPEKPTTKKTTTEATREGVPYEIEPFDNIGGPLANFRDAVTSRCGGDSGCLTIVENNDGDDSDPSQCIVDSIGYDPEPGPEDAPSGERKLQRGTTVFVASTCDPGDESDG